jgi:uncharacterized protein
MQIDYPYHFDQRKRTAAAGDDDHIRDLIEQVLFTSPGERVNRPTFGSGLLQLVFAPIRVEGVAVDSEESTVRVSVQYTVLRTQQRQTAQFVRGA